jgi:hypothetical protein
MTNGRVGYNSCDDGCLGGGLRAIELYAENTHFFSNVITDVVGGGVYAFTATIINSLFENNR